MSIHPVYLYLIFSVRIIIASRRVTRLVYITGDDSIMYPYISHKKTPVQKLINIPKEISLVDLDFQV